MKSSQKAAFEETKISKRMRELREEFNALFWNTEHKYKVSAIDHQMANYTEMIVIQKQLKEIKNEIYKINLLINESNRYFRFLHGRIPTDKLLKSSL